MKLNKTITVGLRIDETLNARIEAAADKASVGKSEFIRTTLVAAVGPKPKPSK